MLWSADDILQTLPGRAIRNVRMQFRRKCGRRKRVCKPVSDSPSECSGIGAHDQSDCQRMPMTRAPCNLSGDNCNPLSLCTLRAADELTVRCLAIRRSPASVSFHSQLFPSKIRKVHSLTLCSLSLLQMFGRVRGDQLRFRIQFHFISQEPVDPNLCCAEVRKYGSTGIC